MVERYLPVCMLLSCFSRFSAVSRSKAGNKLQQNRALTWYQDKDFNRQCLNFSVLKLLFKVSSKANRGDSWSTEHKLCKLLNGRLPPAQCLNLLLSDSAGSLQRLNAAFIRDPVRLNKDFVTLGGGVAEERKCYSAQFMVFIASLPVASSKAGIHTVSFSLCLRPIVKIVLPNSFLIL